MICLDVKAPVSTPPPKNSFEKSEAGTQHHVFPAGVCKNEENQESRLFCLSDVICACEEFVVQVKETFALGRFCKACFIRNMSTGENFWSVLLWLIGWLVMAKYLSLNMVFLEPLEKMLEADYSCTLIKVTRYLRRGILHSWAVTEERWTAGLYSLSSWLLKPSGS